MLYRHRVIARLRELKLKERDTLHLDLGNTMDTTALNLLLFELLIIGTLSARGVLFHMPTIPVFVEIGNTLQNRLLQQVQIYRLYAPTHMTTLSWSLEKLHISANPLSPEQLCCQYLYARETDTLKDRDIRHAEDDAAPPISAVICRRLLAAELPALKDDDCSFTTAATFLNVLACQLRLLSRSAYFRVRMLRDVLSQDLTVRTHVLTALVRFADPTRP